MRLGGLGERKLAPDAQRELAFLDPAEHLARALPELGPRRDVVVQRGARQVERAVVVQHLRVDRRDRAARLAEQRERAARRQAAQALGERVVLVTDRRIGFWEAANQPRSYDYPFTVIELHLNRDGEGEGKMSIATKVIYDKKENMITLENYQTSPVQLTNVKREKVTH